MGENYEKDITCIFRCRIFFIASVFVAAAYSYTESTNKKNGMQAVADAKEAKEAEPHIGDKSEVVFDQFVARAAERCEANEFQHADQLLNIARGIVASE
jgi:hypothetical protein